MSVWSILEIEPTDDVRSIKSAYAKKLKIYHPEDDPEGYQQLREAYDSAIKLAKSGIVSTMSEVEPVYDSDNEDSEYDGEHIFFSRNLIEVEEMDPSENKIKSFMNQVEDLYVHFSARINLSLWGELLDRDVVWDINTKAVVSESVLDFLFEHPYVPNEVWQLLDHCFQWREEIREYEDYYSNRYSEDFIHYLIHMLDKPGLGYSSLLDVGEIDFDDFLRHRNDAQFALIDNKLKDASQSLDAAYTINTDDPDLLRLRVDYFWRIGDIEAAHSTIDHLLTIHHNDVDGHLYRARIMFSNRQYHEAIEDCEIILDILPNHSAVLCLMGSCYSQLGDYDQARESFLKASELDPYNTEVVISMAQLNLNVVSWVKKKGSANTDQALLKDLYKELGKPSFIEIIAQYLSYLPKFRLFLAVLITIGILSAITELILQDPEFKTVESISQLRNRSEGEIVKLKLTDVEVVGLYPLVKIEVQTDINDKNINEVVQKMQNYNKQYSRRISIGNLNDASIFFMPTLKQAAGLNSTNREKTVYGKVVHNTLEDLEEIVSQTLNRPNLSKYNKEYLVKDLYIEGIDITDLKPDTGRSKISFGHLVSSYVLFRLVLFVFRSFIYAFRAARY